MKKAVNTMAGDGGTDAHALVTKSRKIMQLQSEDRISDLPDEILVSILSLLHTKQAVGTSVLAPRWRNLWTFTHHLKFVDCSIDGFLDDNYKAFQVKRTRFVNGVNQVLRLHKGTVTEFILHFRTYTRKFTSDVDSWINFALHNKVKRLNLEFTPLRSTWGSRYYLNTQILQNYCLDSLTTLCLCSMVVTGKVLEYFLSACPLLESLSVSTSSVGDLKVSGPDLKLKHLELLHCDLLSVEISAVNLVSFTYQGPKTRISFQDTPRLIKASFGAPHARSIVKNIYQLPTQLETLELDLRDKNLTFIPHFPKLRNLRQLALSLNVRVISFHLCTSLLRASPSLERWKIEFENLRNSTEENCKANYKGRKANYNGRKVTYPHKCLKVVEIIGFVGCGVDLEIASYILIHTVSLEKIIIDPCHPDRCRVEDPYKLLEARNRARQHLETILPTGTQLVLL